MCKPNVSCYAECSVLALTFHIMLCKVLVLNCRMMLCQDVGSVGRVDLSVLQVSKMPICLHAPCAKSGTDLECTAIYLCVHYAMPGTDLHCSVFCLCARYAVPGTDVACGATRAIGQGM